MTIFSFLSGLGAITLRQSKYTEGKKAWGQALRNSSVSDQTEEGDTVSEAEKSEEEAYQKRVTTKKFLQAFIAFAVQEPVAFLL